MFQDELNERTQQATPKRQQEVKERGQVARSKDLSSWIVLFFGASSCFVFSEFMYKRIHKLFDYYLSFDFKVLFRENKEISSMFLEAASQAMTIVFPLLAVVFFVSIVSPVLVGGWTFTIRNVEFKVERMDPLKGLTRIFSSKSFFELLKSIVKIVIVIAIAFCLFKFFMFKIFQLHHFEPSIGIAHSLNILFWSFIILSCGLLLVCLFDVPYQLWEHQQKLMMTYQEVKDEYKETEGRPEVKSKLNRLQRELSKRRMMKAIEACDVIITNPTHFAVAIKYDSAKMKAPVVVAKGADLIAQKMIEVGNKHGVALVSIPPLARSIFHFSEIGEEIPGKLYLAVAQVLAYVYQLKEFKKGKSKKPKFPEKIEIPNEMVK